MADRIAPRNERRHRGFERSSSLVANRVRKASESRGFAVSRLLTHWAEVVGEEIAAVCKPVEISYGRDGFGGTLTVLTTGAQALMLEMQADRLRERVNACYGYAAVSRVRITQTAPVGFSEGQARFEHAPQAQRAGPDPAARAEAAQAVSQVADPQLRAALEALGANVISTGKAKPSKGS